MKSRIFACKVKRGAVGGKLSVKQTTLYTPLHAGNERGMHQTVELPVSLPLSVQTHAVLALLTKHTHTHTTLKL